MEVLKEILLSPLFNGIWIVRDFSRPTLKRQSLGAQPLNQSQVVQILFLQSSFRVRVCLLNPRETFGQMIPLQWHRVETPVGNQTSFTVRNFVWLAPFQFLAHTLGVALWNHWFVEYWVVKLLPRDVNLAFNYNELLGLWGVLKLNTLIYAVRYTLAFGIIRRMLWFEF